MAKKKLTKVPARLHFGVWAGLMGKELHFEWESPYWFTTDGTYYLWELAGLNFNLGNFGMGFDVELWGKI